MELKYFLWLTGVDPILNHFGARFCFENNTDSIYRELLYTLSERLCEEGYRVEPLDGNAGFIVMTEQRRIAVFTKLLSPFHMAELIQHVRITTIVMLRTKGGFSRKNYVDLASHLNYSFVSQQLPEVWNIAKEDSPSDNQHPINVTIINQPIIINNSQINGEVRKNQKTPMDYIVDLLISILGGVISNAGISSIFSKLLGY